MAQRYALTTKDNPFNPFDQFVDWSNFDHEKHYNTSEYLARFAFTSDELSEQENNSEILRAIDEIIKYDYEGKYLKVSQEYEI